MTHQWPSRQTNDLFQHLFIFLLVEWLTQSSIVHNQTSFSHCMDNLMVCISTSFHVLHATNTWSKYFFQNCFQTLFFPLNCFLSFLFLFVRKVETRYKKCVHKADWQPYSNPLWGTKFSSINAFCVTWILWCVLSKLTVIQLNLRAHFLLFHLDLLCVTSDKNDKKYEK